MLQLSLMGPHQASTTTAMDGLHLSTELIDLMEPAVRNQIHGHARARSGGQGDALSVAPVIAVITRGVSQRARRARAGRARDYMPEIWVCGRNARIPLEGRAAGWPSRERVRCFWAFTQTRVQWPCAGAALLPALTVSGAVALRRAAAVQTVPLWKAPSASSQSGPLRVPAVCSSVPGTVWLLVADRKGRRSAHCAAHSTHRQPRKRTIS